MWRAAMNEPDFLPCGHPTLCLDGHGECRWCGDLERWKKMADTLRTDLHRANTGIRETHI